MYVQCALAVTSMEIYTSDRTNAVNEWNITVEVCVGIVRIELEVVPQFLFLYTSDDTAQGNAVNEMPLAYQLGLTSVSA